MKASHPEVAVAHRVNPGETLRKARESRNLALGDIAQQLNLTAQALRHLETGAFEQLPGHTFARGYIRAYAKLMGLESDRLVAEFDQYTGTDATGSSVSSLSRIEEPARVSQSLLKLFSIAALVALGAVGFFWWQGENQRLQEEAAKAKLEHVEVESADGTTEIHPLTEPEDQAVAEAQVQLPLVADPAQVEARPEAEIAQAAPEAATPQAAVVSDAASPAAVAPQAEQPAPATPSVAAPVAEAATAAVAPVVAASGETLVNLQFTADCWTELTDANGKVLLSALKRRGDSVQLSGKAPLELRLGYARGAVVLVDGKAVDVAPFIHGETARLKLGQ
ncbi:RodZ family helix-turn-helix domain-containing protein [Pseudomonas sp. CAU 1711]|uniref:RodZ family helix-turn-helix domain-containing protein n=1 Tax=Pseudomonas sp. CAU 1711 TaxID=3140356 RepID=UPI0032604EB5